MIVHRGCISLLTLILALAACSSGTGPTPTTTPGAGTPSGSGPVPSSGAQAPEGSAQTTITDWTDPRPAVWADKYPLFAPVKVGDGSLARVQQAGKLVVCTALGIAPWNELDPATGDVVGIEPKLMQSVIKTIGVPKIEYVNLEFQALIPGINAKKCDVISASLGIRGDRAEQIRYTLPWVLTFDQFAVASGANLTSSDQLVDKKIGTFQGSADEDVLRAWVTSHGDKAKILYFNTPNECFLATTNGTIDACFTDNVSVSAAIGKVNGLTAIKEAFPYAAGFPKDAKSNPYILLSIGPSSRRDDGDLNLAIAIAVKKLIDDKTQQQVLEKFGLWDPKYQTNFIRSDS